MSEIPTGKAALPGEAAGLPYGIQESPAARLDRLAREAYESIRAFRPSDGVAALQELQRAMPDDPKVQQLAACIAVMGFSWPLARERFVPETGVAPAGEDVDLVYFHADRPEAASGFHEAIDYLGVLALSLESAAITAPRARRILLTDEATAVPAGLPAHEVRRVPLDVERLMYERMRAQLAYLRERPAGRSSVLMDSDIVVNRDPAAVFAEVFDVGLTWRPEYADAPFNGGVIFAGRGARAVEFFERTLACYDALAADERVTSVFERDLLGWWGDQYALAITVGHRAIAENHDAGVSVQGIGVRLFPCSHYNFTPITGPNRPAEGLASRYFLHFKGNRKEGLERYLKQLRKRYGRRA